MTTKAFSVFHTAAIVAALASGCAAKVTPRLPLPTFVNVEFRQALIGPSKVGGAAWDGVGHIDVSAAGELQSALRAVDPYAGVLSFFANPTLDALEKPEPRGRARSTAGGTVVENLELTTLQRDTLTPIWQNPRLMRVPLAPTTRIELELYDEDVLNDDAMGAATISYAELVAALRAGTLHHVRVAEQTNNQVLFIDISVEDAR